MPDRQKEGYGLTMGALDRALDQGFVPEVFLALDCGTNSFHEVEKLKKAKFMSAGKPSPEDSNLTRMRLKRKWTEQYAGGAPEVLKEDNTPWVYETDGPVGNGSIVAVIVDVYDTKASKQGIYGSRLSKVKVLEHIPYIKDEFGDLGSAEQEEVKPAAKAKAPSKVDLEDEIPF
jgi:hypothetical protein